MKKIEKINVSDIFELSMVQKGMLFHYLKEADENLYNVQLVFNINGPLDTGILQEAFLFVQSRHEVLHSVFSWELSSKPLQIVLKSCPIEIALHDVSDESHDEIESFIEQYLFKDQHARFDLTGLPVRSGAIKTGNESFVFHITHHHILYDGWSTAILLKELFHCYNQLCNHQQPALHVKPAYKQVLRNIQSQQHHIKSELFWKEYLKDYKLTAFFARSSASSGVQKLRLVLPMEKFDAFAKKQKVTRTALVYAAYGILLLKCNNVTDIVFGTTISDRDPGIQGLDQQVGNFVNTIPLRINNVNEHSLCDAVDEVNRQLISRNQFHSTSLYEMKQMLGLQPEDSLFDSTVGIKNYPVDEGLVKSIDALNISLRSVYENTDVSLAVSVFFRNELEIEFDYKTSVLEEEDIQLLADHFNRVLNEIVDSPHKKVSELSLLSDDERDKILNQFNATDRDYAVGSSVIDLFDQQVQLTPNHTALVYQGKKLSYAALKERAEGLAAYLQNEGVVSGDVVGLMTEPSLEMIIGMLGILKAGAAYLPVNPDNPATRTAAMCAETKSKVLLTQEKIAKAQTYNAVSVRLPVVLPENLLYIIYTSGTTGSPKGVMITHGNMVNYASWSRWFLKLNETNRWVLTHSFTFDAANTAIFSALLSGAELHLLAKELYTSPGELLDHLQQQRITHMKMTPSLYSTVAEHASLEKIGTLQMLMMGGEKINVGDIEKTFRAAPNISVVNHYGPTETTVGSISRYVHRTEMEHYKHHPSVGRPISNTKCYILDNAKNMVPIGDKGELYIGGKGVAKGYLGREDLTREKFVDDPFQPGGLMYKTGDVARWLPDGNIEFLGRIDNQVKIRGYRVELGEIESQLRNHDLVKDTVVLLKNIGGNQCLVAYYVSSREFTATELRDYLSERLPDYMIPSYYVLMDSMPLTVSGKLNRHALPEPSMVRDNEYEAPATEPEKLLADVWSKVLGIEKVSTADKFFALGGDSIKSIQISSRMRSLGYQVTVKDIFTSQTIRDLARRMKRVEELTDQSLVTGSVALTPIQQWLLNSDAPHKHHYNQSVMLNFVQGISKETVHAIFYKLQQHHDALRMVFRKQGDVIVQENLAEMPVSITEYDLRNNGETVASLANKLQSGIDLENGPLMKLGLFHLNDGSRLLIVIHHLVVDAVSWRILFEDIETLYRQGSLPEKTLSFQAWANKAVNVDAPAYDDVPSIRRDFENGINNDNTIAAFSLSKETTSKLLKEAHEAFNTQVNDILLTALMMSVNKQFGLNKLVVDLEGHGRDETVSRTVGWFTVIYPVLLEIKHDDLSQTLRSVKEGLRVEQQGVNIRSKIKFNYLGQFDADISGNSFEIASDEKGFEVSPENLRQHDWDLIGMVRNGQLQMQLPYSPHQYKAETINAFMTAYRQSLLELVDHCCSQQNKLLSPSDLSYKAISVQQLDALQEKYELEDVYPLSPMQEGMLFHSLIDAGEGHYFEQKMLTLKGKVDVSVLQQSLERLMQRYPVLRTAFVHKGFERPLQVVLRQRKPEFVFYDVRGKGDVQEYQNAARSRSFDLVNDPLVRVIVLQTSDDEFELIWNHHHILMDGWCMGIIFNDLIAICQNNELPPVKPYSNYIEWLEKRDRDQSVQYWKEYLSGYETLAGFPRKENQAAGYKLSSSQINIEAKSLRDACSAMGITVNTMLQTAWGILLSKYNNTSDVVFGSVVSGRPAEVEGVESMVGLFINTIPVRITAEPQEAVADVLLRIQSQAIRGEAHHYHPLTEVQSLSTLGRELLDHILVFENYPISLKMAGTDDFTVTNVRVHEQTNYDLVLLIIPGENIQLKIDYNANVYEQQRIDEILRYFTNVIHQLISSSHVRIEDVDIMSEDEQHQHLLQLNNTAVPYPANITINELFSQQVKKTPHRVAVQYENDILTYDALDKRANKLAMLLRDNGVKADHVVALLTDRSIDTVVSMLAILKTGGAYLPIDIDYPRERIEYLITDSKTKILLTSRKLQTDIHCKARILYIEDAPNVAGDIIEIENINKPSDLCYIIYTSGTTGNPKGVMVEHRNLVRLFFNQQFQFRFDENDVWTMFHSPCFDFSVWEMYGALLFGGKVIVIPKMVARDTKAYFSILQHEGVTVLNQTPSAFYNLIQEALQQNLPQLALRYVVFGGEALSPRKLKAWRDHYPKVQLINMFGITETTVHVTYKEIGDHEIEHNISNVGKPIPTLSVCILDKTRKPVPNGVTGELHVGGAGVSRGYLGKKELTKTKFIADPYHPGQRLYCSGDLARILSSGDIEYIGRMDDQVKIRGFRIELGEIENALQSHPDVSAAIVIAKDETLIAYITANNNLQTANLKEFLLKTLPDYMVPTHYVQLKEFPLTSNGKLDKKALPAPEIKIADESAKPKNHAQKALVKIWSDILSVEESRIGIHTNFFDVGGNSLKLVKMVDKINSHFKSDITVAKVFTYPVISSLAEFLENKQPAEPLNDGMQSNLEQMHDAINLFNQIQN